ncbi:NUDIX domain-containing protein [Jiulongibacter sp. NS-SX5]|uniref:NUDIX domain-containing protein n=1 Tax=Jiulongibacter sp. NS-SX5 TaxID=3463854 RepID=UPI004059B8A5
MADNLAQQIEEKYGNRIRVRVCGCLVHKGKILLLKHEAIGPEGYFWNVPGGQPETGESIEEALKREFKEETNLNVKVGSFLIEREFIDDPLHAIELYFEVNTNNTNARLGFDPEEVDVLSELAWFSKSEFDQLPKEAKPYFLKNYINFD